MDRAYSVLTIKTISDAGGKRTFSGIATTPSTDRMGDIIDSEGATYKLPVPLLWQHDSSQPIGWVNQAAVTKDGIAVDCEFAQVDEPGTLKDRLDEAWQSIKAKLVRGLSIGFIGQEVAYMKETGGLHYLQWDWLELSCVTIPANADANIQTVKSFDLKQEAASGRILPRTKGVVVPPVASGNSAKKRPVTTKGKDMNTAERIAALQAARAAKAAKMDTLMQKSVDTGETLDAESATEFDALDDEIKLIDADLSRLDKLQKMAVASAKTVDGSSSAKGSDSRVVLPAQVKVRENLAKGIQFARYAMCLGAAKGEKAAALSIAMTRFPNDEAIIATLKAAVNAGTTTDATWAGSLLEYQTFAGDFIEFLRSRTIVGQFGTGSIPALRQVPFNIHIKGQTSGGAGYWVGQGLPKPVTKFDFSDVYMGFTKLAAIAVLTEELMRFSMPSAETMVRDALAEAIIERVDIDFIDPAKAAVSGVSPASITNGVTHIHSSGETDIDVRADLAALWAVADGSNMPAQSAVYIMAASTARRLSMMRNPLGQPSFPGIGMMGGLVDGVPVIVSNYVAGNSAGGIVILAFASEIFLADDGQVVIDASREASIQMDSAPTNSSSPATPTSVVSMFQTNSVALRAERYINWQKRRPQAVAVLDDVNWGA